jgi:hypothetical protein
LALGYVLKFLSQHLLSGVIRFLIRIKDRERDESALNFLERDTRVSAPQDIRLNSGRGPAHQLLTSESGHNDQAKRRVDTGPKLSRLCLRTLAGSFFSSHFYFS